MYAISDPSPSVAAVEDASVCICWACVCVVDVDAGAAGCDCCGGCACRRLPLLPEAEPAGPAWADDRDGLSISDANQRDFSEAILAGERSVVTLQMERSDRWLVLGSADEMRDAVCTLKRWYLVVDVAEWR
jgi:hypothetical protein